MLIFITVTVLRYGGKDGLKLTGFQSMYATANWEGLIAYFTFTTI
jgi:hypothetical protein